MKLFDKTLLIQLTKYKSLEISWNYWNPINHIGFQRSFDLWLKGDHAPYLNIYLCFICVALDIEFYDNRHENER